ncbi:MAG: hypothetical protein WCG27_09480, partial [Pseudomonadota bacterium]
PTPTPIPLPAREYLTSQLAVGTTYTLAADLTKDANTGKWLVTLTLSGNGGQLGPTLSKEITLESGYTFHRVGFVTGRDSSTNARTCVDKFRALEE